MVRDVVRESWSLFHRRFWRTLLIVGLLLAPLELVVAVFDPDFSAVAPGWWWWVAISAAVTLLAFPWVAGAIVHDVGLGDERATEAYRGMVIDTVAIAFYSYAPFVLYRRLAA